MILNAATDTEEPVLAWTSLLVASVAVHVADSVEVPSPTEQSIVEQLRRAIEVVLDRPVLVDGERGCGVPEQCAARVLERTQSDEIVLVYLYGGIARTQVIIRRARPSGFLSSEEVIVSKDGQNPPDWNGVVSRSFWDLVRPLPKSTGASWAGPITLIAAGSASLITSLGFGVWAGQVASDSNGLVDDELASKLDTYDTARTTSLVLLGTGAGLVIAGSVWAILRK